MNLCCGLSRVRGRGRGQESQGGLFWTRAQGRGTCSHGRLSTGAQQGVPDSPLYSF